jgi:cytochrome c peroxidase
MVRLVMGSRWVYALATLLGALGVAMDGGSIRASAMDTSVYEEACQGRQRSSPLAPLPVGHRLDAAKVALGRELFHDPRLSGDGSIACASCHDVESGGDDGRVHSRGIGGREGRINAPSVLNRGFDFRLFWDGRAANLVEQIDGPLQDAAEMGSSWDTALGRLVADRDFSARFGHVYPSGLTAANVRDAIATYERSLITPGSPFDRYLCGDDAALEPAARRGYELFLSYGCVSCHQGRNAGGNMYQRFGVLGDYFADRGGVTTADLGRFNQTGHEADRYVFKVPSLRNVEHTAPYFHDGSKQKLEEAIEVMGRYQLGRELSPREIADLAAFLRSLSAPVWRAP